MSYIFRLSHSLHHVQLFKKEMESTGTSKSSETVNSNKKHNIFNNFRKGEL